MNAIEKSIYDLKFSIPRDVLESVFIRRNNTWRQSSVLNIDEQIRALIIRPKVLVDCDLVGGEQALIPLDGLGYDRPNEYMTIIRIPKDRTNQRSILSVLHVSFLSQNFSAYSAGMNPTSSGYNSKDNSAATGAMAGVVAALDKIPVVSTAKASLVGENVILIRDLMTIFPNCYLRCILSNDDNLANINHRSYPAFSKLVEFAVKAYIYNELIVQIDSAELQGGQALGVFKNIIEGYSDSLQNYNDYLKQTWRKVAFTNDQMSYERLIKLTVGGYR